MTTADPLTLYRAEVLQWLWGFLGQRHSRGTPLPAPVADWFYAVADQLCALGPFLPEETLLGRWVLLLDVPGCPVLADGAIAPGVLVALREVRRDTAA